MGTSALVPAWCPFSDKNQQIHRGFAARVFKESKKHTPHVAEGELDWVPIAAEHLKRIYDAFVLGAGVRVRFDVLLAGVVTDSHGTVTALITADKKGLRAISGKVIVDATGDADVVFKTGVPIHEGDDQGGELMPATMCFTLANVRGFETGRPPDLKGKEPGGISLIERIVADKKYPEIPDEHICAAWVGPGCMGFNAGHIYGVNNTDPDNVSVALVQGRKMANVYRNALADYCPEFFAEAFLVSTGALLGVRETRRIVADYELTIEDYLARRDFADEICRNAYFIDVHLMKDEAKSGNWESRVHGAFERYKPGESHGIPYRCLCPKGLTNVLVAGRSIGTDRTVNGSVRIMPVCLNTGEAAGIAAARAAANGGNVHQVDTTWLRAQIMAKGGYIL
jgi:FAD dependent oxidoreductase